MATTMREMLEAGVHFGHQTRRWNPRMRPFIFTERNGIHILDLAQTVRRLEEALTQVRETVSAGDSVLFVGTKKQAREIVRREAERCGMPFVNTRWLGGTLINWQTIARRIERLKEHDERAESGSDAALPKKERLRLDKERARMERSFGGLRRLTRLPGLVFVVDPTMADIAVQEANRVRVPVVAMCDTNADPDIIKFPVPSNDDAIRAIQLITGLVADSVLEGRAYSEVEEELAAQQRARAAAASADAAEPSGEAAPAPATPG